MKILAVGDLVGEGGVKKLKELLPRIREEEKIDFVIVNAENSAGGMGITTKIFNELKELDIVDDNELKQSKGMLRAAALTYVASVATSLLEIFRLLTILNRRR